MTKTSSLRRTDRIVGLIVLILLTAVSPALAVGKSLWVTAYYPVWNQDGGMSPDKIDYSAITHLVHFSIVPDADGTILQQKRGALNVITPAQSAEVVADAHKGGVKALICLGGAGTGPVISRVIAGPLRGVLIKNLIAFVSSRGYDGIDVDMEPVPPSDESNFVAFVQDLRAAMKAANPRWLLTMPASGEPGDQPKLCALLKDDLDQINIQTYDLSGTWSGFKTWYNGSLYGEGKTLLTDTRPYPSVDEKVGLYLAAGIPKEKLGIGIAFYGDAWAGASGPMQSIDGVSITAVGYNAIMDQDYQPDRYHWDALAHAPYLSIGASHGPGNQFISYDDGRLAREKVVYARTRGLGGVIIWELGDGYRASQPVGQRDGLLQDVKRAMQSPLSADPAMTGR